MIQQSIKMPVITNSYTYFSPLQNKSGLKIFMPSFYEPLPDSVWRKSNFLNIYESVEYYVNQNLLNQAEKNAQIQQRIDRQEWIAF